MNRYAYLATGRMVALMERVSKLKVRIHGQERIPDGSLIFVVNHFTRIETILLPYHIFRTMGVPVWTLADASLFEGAFGTFLDKVGTLSTRDPDRDRLIVKSLLTGEANWIIFPEGRMVKDKGAFQRRFFPRGKRWRPRSGAASLALRTEFYRERLRLLSKSDPEEAQRLKTLFGIADLAPVLSRKTWIVPVNITYYPLRAQQNLLSGLADRFLKGIPSGLKEEILTEGSMVFRGVDVDIRIGAPLAVTGSLCAPRIQHDIAARERIDFDDGIASLKEMRREAVRLMERYMSAIYGLTTVNHDHLFASVLRATLFQSISEDDFRRRVYLVVSGCHNACGVTYHNSLESEQISLLTDDRYHKYRDFLLLALETGVVTRRDGELIKERLRSSPPFEPTKIRLENPIAVIANEVVPLSALQREVRLTAWLPAWEVRRRVANLLERRAREEFESDYQTFYRAGESKDRSVGAPVLLRGSSRRLGVVLVHGYLSAPKEVAELARFLNEKGYWVYQVRLKGHGTSPEDLALRTGADWIESVDLGYALMSTICRRVAIGGFSFGGGVALECASRIPTLAAAFAVSPPHLLRDISSRLAPALTVWNRVLKGVKFRGAKMEYVQTAPERPQINYGRLPVAGLWELERFMRELGPKLSRVHIPTLVVQGDRDPVVDPRGSRRFFEMLGSKEKEYLLFPRGNHGILAGEGAHEIHAAIGAFLEPLAS